jgi:hypothetical protein
MSKINLIYAPASKVERWNSLRLLRRAARALLYALHDSRERAARKIIHDHRNLLPQQGSVKLFQEGCKGISRDSQGNLKEMK